MDIRVVFVIMLISSIAFYAMAFRVPVVRNIPALPTECSIRWRWPFQAKTLVPYPDCLHYDLRYPLLLRHGCTRWCWPERDRHQAHPEALPRYFPDCLPRGLLGPLRRLERYHSAPTLGPLLARWTERCQRPRCHCRWCDHDPDRSFRCFYCRGGPQMGLVRNGLPRLPGCCLPARLQRP